MEEDEDCPKCRGSGRVSEGGVSLVCNWCEGSGSLSATRILRAYKRGFEDGLEAMRNAMPQQERPMTLERLASIVNRHA